MEANSAWRKSSYSGGSTGNCVEVATADSVLVRDTASRDGFTLALSGAAWTAFVASLR